MTPQSPIRTLLGDKESRKMLTKIIIEHDTKAALKATGLWREAMELFLAEGAVSVILIGEAKPDEIPNADVNS